MSLKYPSSLKYPLYSRRRSVPPNGDIDSTLAWLEEARVSHVVWADYLDTHELQDPLAKQGLGTADYHRLWVAQYTTMIGVARAIEGIC